MYPRVDYCGRRCLDVSGLFPVSVSVWASALIKFSVLPGPVAEAERTVSFEAPMITKMAGVVVGESGYLSFCTMKVQLHIFSLDLPHNRYRMLGHKTRLGLEVTLCQWTHSDD